jgi:hypothetical protein
MTLRENEQHRSHRALRSHRKQLQRKRRKHKRRSALDAPLAATTLHDNQVLSFFEWAQLNKFSERTGRRILKSGNGPPVVQLSARRIGITIRANREWQEARARA